MTEKRFTKGIECGFITCFYDNGEHMDTDVILNTLNELNEENTRLLQANLKLTDENTTILSTIRQSYQNEKTTFGRNILKQLMDAIQ